MTLLGKYRYPPNLRIESPGLDSRCIAKNPRISIPSASGLYGGSVVFQICTKSSFFIKGCWNWSVSSRLSYAQWVHRMDHVVPLFDCNRVVLIAMNAHSVFPYSLKLSQVVRFMINPTRIPGGFRVSSTQARNIM